MIITNAKDAKDAKDAKAQAQVLRPEPPEPVIVQRMGQAVTDEPGPSEPVIVQRMGQAVVTDEPEPPPYFPRQVSAPMPTIQAPTPTTYAPQIHRSVSTSALRIPLPPPRRPSPVKREILATNYLYLHTKKEPVIGTFHIDPDIPMVELDKTGTLTVNRQAYNKKHKQKHRHHNKKNKRTQNQVPNAIFQSKTGDISLNLAVVAPPLVGSSPALIQASSKRGDIDIKIPFINSLRTLNLEVSTKHGNILVLVPRSFSGYIQVYSKDSKEGKLTFLPNIKSAMNIVSRRDRETQVVVGDAVYNTPMQGMGWTGDTIHIASCHGSIYIGYVNEDRKPIEEAGFWKKLVDGMVDVLSK